MKESQNFGAEVDSELFKLFVLVFVFVFVFAFVFVCVFVFVSIFVFLFIFVFEVGQLGSKRFVDEPLTPPSASDTT